METKNPFYHNYVFTELDLKRHILKWWQMPWQLLFKPTYIQLNDGYVFHFKLHAGAIYMIKQEEFNP